MHKDRSLPFAHGRIRAGPREFRARPIKIFGAYLQAQLSSPLIYVLMTQQSELRLRISLLEPGKKTVHTIANGYSRAPSSGGTELCRVSHIVFLIVRAPFAKE